MRVVGGSARGTKLAAVPGDTTRPILDRVKTALFDILRPRLENMRMLDMFSGSGSVGIEALSQGAANCIFLDTARAAIATIYSNLDATNLRAQAEVRETDAFRYLRHTSHKFDLVYVAPPQYQALWVRALHDLAERPHLLNPGSIVIAQIDPDEYEALSLTTLRETQARKYGNTLLLFFEN